MKALTIFTPTYNRAYILPKLYESLCKQSCQDFIWLIVDDGSTDKTENFVREWVRDGKIAIEYTRQENGGKMRAHNLGVSICTTPLFCCVDSDDYLCENAIESIIEFWSLNYHNEEDICGFISYRAMVVNGQDPKILKRFPSIKSCRMHDLVKKYSHRGETTIVFRTDVIKHYPFPEIEGEKFITEAFVYDQIDQSYKTLLYDKALTVCEYQSDGYTKSRANIYKIAPKGWALYYNQQCKLWKQESQFKDYLKFLVYYIVMAKIAGNKHIYKESYDKSWRYFVASMVSPYYKNKIERLFC